MRVVRAFACEFKCGQRVTSKRASMAKHEAQCIHNPATRSCPTCAHNEVEESDVECGIYGGYFCAANRLESGQSFRKECPHWKEDSK